MEENNKEVIKEGLLAAEKSILFLKKTYLEEGLTHHQIENGLSKIKQALLTLEEDGLSETEKERKRMERKYAQKLKEKKLKKAEKQVSKTNALTCPYCKKETEKERWSWREIAHDTFGIRRYDGCRSCLSAISKKYSEDPFWLGVNRNLRGKKHTRLIREALFEKTN